MKKKPDRKLIAVLALLAGMAWAAGAASGTSLHKSSSNEKSFTAGAL